MKMGNTGAQISSTELVSRVNKGILQFFNIGIPMVTSACHTVIKPDDKHSALV